MASVMEAWRFKTAPSGRWVWQRVSDGGDVVSQSDVDFRLLEECAADARRSGYPGVIAAYAASE